MPRLTIRPRARRDIEQHLEHLEEQGGLDLAERFLDSLMQSGEDLARMPKMAPLCGFRRPALRLLRRWPVKGFENWLIFYQARRDGAEIVHVIHGARDVEQLLNA